jgi:anti-sigma factor RsiW
VKDFFALYLYGELSFDEEERVESHLDACLDCRKALERQREVQSALDNLAIEPAPSLLRSCREDLHYAPGGRGSGRTFRREARLVGTIHGRSDRALRIRIG